MWKELLDLCGELFFNQWRYVRDERKVEKKQKIVEEGHNDYLLLHGMKVQEEKGDVCQ